MPTCLMRAAAGTLLATVALSGAAACSSGAGNAPQTTTQPAPTSAPASPGGGAAAPGDAQRQALGRANQGAQGLIALGGLGTDKGVGQQVTGLAPELTDQGRAMLDQIRQAATAAGVALGDQLDPQTQAVLADLQARSGSSFDPAWLQAVQAQLQQARTALTAVLNDPAASEQAKAAARDALARLDALSAQVSQAAAAAGAGTPGGVAAGTGGQAAQDAVLPAALGGAGVVLLGTAGVVTVCGRRTRS